jgi:hypothetical protein
LSIGDKVSINGGGSFGANLDRLVGGERLELELCHGFRNAFPDVIRFGRVIGQRLRAACSMAIIAAVKAGL